MSESDEKQQRDAKRYRELALIAKAKAAGDHEPTNAHRDALWVYQNMLVPLESIRPEDIPGSPGAIALLQVARDNPPAFINGIFKDVRKLHGDQEKESAFEDDGRSIEEIDRAILSALGEGERFTLVR